MKQIVIISKNLGVIVFDALFIYKAFAVANSCFLVSSVPFAQGLPMFEDLRRLQIKRNLPGHRSLIDYDFEMRKELLVTIAKETRDRYLGDKSTEEIAQILKLEAIQHQQIGEDYYLWRSANTEIPLANMTEIQRLNTLNISLVNARQAKKLCRIGACALLGSFTLGSFNVVEFAVLQRFSTILGIGQIFMGIELAQRVHPSMPFNIWPNNIDPNSAKQLKQFQLRLYTPDDTKKWPIYNWIKKRVRDTFGWGVLAVFTGGALVVRGEKLPDEPGTITGDLISTLRKPWNFLVAKTPWVTPHSGCNYFAYMKKNREIHIKKADPKFSNEEIVKEIRRVCSQWTDQEIDSIFIHKKRFCSYDKLYNEHECNELYSRLEDLKLSYLRWCLKDGNETAHKFTLKERFQTVYKRYKRWQKFRNSTKPEWKNIVLGDPQPMQKSTFDTPKALTETVYTLSNKLKAEYIDIDRGGAIINPQGTLNNVKKNIKFVDLNDCLMKPIDPQDEKMRKIAYRKLKNISRFGFRGSIPKKIQVKEIVTPMVTNIDDVKKLKIKVNGGKRLYQKIKIFTPFRLKP